MMFVRALNEGERQELKRLARREVGRVSERIRMILLSSKGYSVQQIADIFECDHASVRAWIERFEAEGVMGLHDRPRCGRPRKAGVVAQEQLRQTVATHKPWLPSPSPHNWATCSDCGLWLRCVLT